MCLRMHMLVRVYIGMLMCVHIQGVPKKKQYRNKEQTSQKCIVCARYKDYYIILLGANII